jgi:hypothetical protein
MTPLMSSSLKELLRTSKCGSSDSTPYQVSPRPPTQIPVPSHQKKRKNGLQFSDISEKKTREHFPVHSMMPISP